MRTHIGVIVVKILIIPLLLSGCTPSTGKKYSHQLVQTYAGLMVLHEKEKLNTNSPDSVYRIKVREFLASKNISEGDLQKQVADISQDDNSWKAFLSETTATMDSIKSAKPM